MKRFMVDMALVFILVAIGSMFLKSEPSPIINEQIALFEENVKNQTIIETKIDGNAVNPVELNKVTQAVKSSGELIEEVVAFSVEAIASLFSYIVE